jgi:hypothetical protein
MWPTPAARDCKGANSREHCETNGTGRKHLDQLANAVAHPDLMNPAISADTHSTVNLLEFMAAPTATEKDLTRNATTWATPQARDFRTGSTDRWDDPERSRNLSDQIGGQLNPTWVEWLMGWPLGWTDLKPLATDKFLQWLRSHGAF